MPRSDSKPVSGPPRRDKVFDLALAAVSRRSDPVSTVKLSDANAKGVVQIDVSVSNPNPQAAADLACGLYDTLRAKYPRAEK